MSYQKWIRVRDRVPEKGQKVLGFDSFYGNLYLCVNAGELDDFGNPWLQPDDGTTDCSITHWIPLPAPPNVEEPEEQTPMTPNPPVAGPGARDKAKQAYHATRAWLHAKYEADGRVLPDGGFDNCTCEECAECYAWATLDGLMEMYPNIEREATGG